MEDLKKIIATFVKKDSAEIQDNTMINNTVIPGSILIHRMYAAINKAGYEVKDYNNIRNYGELLERLNVGSKSQPGEQKGESIAKKKERPRVDGQNISMIGVDIEWTGNLPEAVDIREGQFYKNNFTEREIAYALLKSNPYETLAGIFCAKEAICKAQNELRALPFNEIEIEHSEEGAPEFRGFSLSISHAGGYSVAVAVNNSGTGDGESRKKGSLSSDIQGIDLVTSSDAGVQTNNKISNISLIISLASIALSLVLLFLLLRK